MASSELPEYMVLDGGLATEIAWTHGHRYIDGDPLWSARLLATNTEVIKAVHRSFLEAGSDVIETSTYQASIEGFTEHLSLSQSEARDLIIRSGHIAREVRDEFWSKTENQKDRVPPLVAGSLGPYGACRHDYSEYTGNYVDTITKQELREFHLPRVSAVFESGVDLIGFDTVPALLEAEVLADILTEFPSKKAWISFSVKDGEHTGHGEKYHEAVSALEKYDQVIGVGMNCCHPQHVTSLLQQIPESVKQTKHIVVYPNSGEQWSSDKKWVNQPDSTPLHEYIPEWLENGANWIGGCCCIKPADVTLVKNALQGWLKKRSKAETV